MVPKYHDPAQIRFINSKFLLATNDESNPVRLARQITADNEHDVAITLQTGEVYTDTINSVHDLIALTSNQAWVCTLEVEFSLKSSVQDELISSLMTICNLNWASEVQHIDPYLITHRMIPQRTTISSQFLTVGLEYGDGDWFTGWKTVGAVLLLNVTVISPAQFIAGITSDMGSWVCNRFRKLTSRIDTPTLSISSRNLIHSGYEKLSLVEGVDTMKSKTPTERWLELLPSGATYDVTRFTPSQLRKLLQTNSKVVD
jgi:hypothetical protein